MPGISIAISFHMKKNNFGFAFGFCVSLMLPVLAHADLAKDCEDTFARVLNQTEKAEAEPEALRKSNHDFLENFKNSLSSDEREQLTAWAASASARFKIERDELAKLERQHAELTTFEQERGVGRMVYFVLKPVKGASANKIRKIESEIIRIKDKIDAVYPTSAEDGIRNILTRLTNGTGYQSILAQQWVQLTAYGKRRTGDFDRHYATVHAGQWSQHRDSNISVLFIGKDRTKRAQLFRQKDFWSQTQLDRQGAIEDIAGLDKPFSATLDKNLERQVYFNIGSKGRVLLNACVDLPETSYETPSVIAGKEPQRSYLPRSESCSVLEIPTEQTGNMRITDRAGVTERIQYADRIDEAAMRLLNGDNSACYSHIRNIVQDAAVKKINAESALQIDAYKNTDEGLIAR